MEAMKSIKREQWKAAVDEEIKAHIKNRTWQETEMPKNQRVIDSKWIFKLKKTPSEPDRFKARLVARGFWQKEGIDYDEIYAPVVRYESIRVLLALAASEDLHIRQFDVKTAFLHGKLKEEIYLQLPEGPWPQEKRVVRLDKTLYGLKQAPNCWNRCFCEFLKKFSFRQSAADECIFIGEANNTKIYLALYADDGLLMSKSEDT